VTSRSMFLFGNIISGALDRNITAARPHLRFGAPWTLVHKNVMSE
jgi:hypothetical protein